MKLGSLIRIGSRKRAFKVEFEAPILDRKGKFNWKTNGPSGLLYTGAIKIYLAEFEPKLVTYDHFGDKYIKKAFFEIIEISQLCIKQTVLK